MGPSAVQTSQVDDAVSMTESEKREQGLAEWRKRYGGRQRECVVCLEEYVDGVSRVMSLPCGHEFHVDCITPWLTTRRRTCPICKGDVVRSLARHDRFGYILRQNSSGGTDSESDTDASEHPLLDNTVVETIPEDADEDVEMNGVGRTWMDSTWQRGASERWTSFREWINGRGRQRDGDPDRTR